MIFVELLLQPWPLSAAPLDWQQALHAFDKLCMCAPPPPPQPSALPSLTGLLPSGACCPALPCLPACPPACLQAAAARAAKLVSVTYSDIQPPIISLTAAIEAGAGYGPEPAPWSEVAAGGGCMHSIACMQNMGVRMLELGALHCMAWQLEYTHEGMFGSNCRPG